jgi:hypothetical protein
VGSGLDLFELLRKSAEAGAAVDVLGFGVIPFVRVQPDAACSARPDGAQGIVEEERSEPFAIGVRDQAEMGEFYIGRVDAVELAKANGTPLQSENVEACRGGAKKAVEVGSGYAQSLIPAQRFADGAVQRKERGGVRPLLGNRCMLDRWRKALRPQAVRASPYRSPAIEPWSTYGHSGSMASIHAA